MTSTKKYRFQKKGNNMKANETTSLDHENLFRLLQEMNLTVAARKVRELLARAQTRQLSYSQFLLDLLGEESQGRYERKLARGLKLSRLGNVKSLEEFDFSVRNKLSAAVVKELLTCPEGVLALVPSPEEKVQRAPKGFSSSMHPPKKDASRASGSRKGGPLYASDEAGPASPTSQKRSGTPLA